MRQKQLYKGSMRVNNSYENFFIFCMWVHIILFNDIAFGASLFIFCDLNTYFQFYFTINFSQRPVIFFKCLKIAK